MKKKYTVVLLRPDYIAEEYGEDTYVAFVETDAEKSFKAAIVAAQKQVYKADRKDKVWVESADDYKAIAIFEGHHECLYWAWMS